MIILALLSKIYWLYGITMQGHGRPAAKHHAQMCKFKHKSTTIYKIKTKTFLRKQDVKIRHDQAHDHMKSKQNAIKLSWGKNVIWLRKLREYEALKA